MAVIPNTYYLPQTEHTPNNPLPVLHYKNVLPKPRTEEAVTEFLTANKWEKRGTWGAVWISHFHPNSHECYGVFQGSSTLLLGAAGEDETDDVGLRVTVHMGDVIVLPAGTGHSSVESTGDYRYIGVYPEGCPRWRNEFGKTRIDERTFSNEVAGVGYAKEDPVYGKDGPLMQLWPQLSQASL
ncbi:cupin domain-containing protein [Aspergillus stella-maris]|uniref:cupin domain-containing protein n=1 Tax=Aspergillus stella-maris TaxID=1810926 RepID=UPI003CCE292D